MSSFICETCGKEIIDTPQGYVTGCEHYPIETSSGKLLKHMVSILDLVDDISKDRHARQETWEERIGDAVNYLILLEGLVAERNNERFDREAQNEAHV